MNDRKQQKWGWAGGWLGGFIWVYILAVVFLLQGKLAQGAIGLIIAVVATVAIFWFSPWRHPRVSYRLLMLPIYGLFVIAFGWCIWAADGIQALGFTSWWSALILLPALIPFWTVGKRRWDNDEN